MKHNLAELHLSRQRNGWEGVFTLIIVMGAFGLASTLSQAAEPGKPDASDASESVFRLGTVTVYGEAAQPADLVPVSVNATDLELREKKNLSDALSVLPGVTLTRFAGRNDASVYVRGFSRNQVPLFIDGVPVYVPYDGTIDMARFTTYDVAEISLSKGYSSVLYGANTMGGVINLVTRQPTAPLEGQFGAGVFTGNGREASLNLGSRQKLGYFQLGGSLVEQDHYELSDNFKPVPAENGDARDNSDRRDWKINAKAAYTPNATDEYAVGFIHQEGKKGNPTSTIVTPSYWRWPKWNKETVYAVSNTRLGADSYVKPRIYYDKYDNSLAIYDDATYTTQNNFNAAKNSGSGTSEYNDFSWGGSVEAGTDALAQNSIKGNVQYKFDHHKERPDLLHRIGTHFIDEDEGESFALEDTYHASSVWDLQGGLDYDFHHTVKAVDSSTGLPYPEKKFTSANPQAGVFYKLGDTGAFHLTVSHKSRFPTMKERYSYRMPDNKGNPQGMPNPALEPESAMHYEIGYEGKIAGGLTLQTAAFYSRIQDTITSVVVVPAAGTIPAVSQFQNVGTSDKSGLDLGLNYDWQKWLKTGVSYSWLRQRTLTILPTNTAPVEVTSVPGQSGSAFVEVRPIDWLSLIPSVQHSSWFYSTSDGKGHNPTLGGYTLANFKISARLPKGVTASIGVENVADKNYQLQDGYPEAGRSWFANIRYAF
jgi:iron complex outermembrane receptor protein